MNITRLELRQIIKEAQEQEVQKIEKAQEIAGKAQDQGININSFDANSLVTSLIGGLGGFASLTQIGKPVALAIDATLLIKMIYDCSQSMNAIADLNRNLKPIVGRDLMRGAVFSVAPITEQEMSMIASAPERVKAKLRRLAISSFQYQRRALVSALGAIPSPTGASDTVLAALSVAISTAPVAEALIAGMKAVANISDQFPGLHEMAQKDTFVGKSLRMIVNVGGSYTIGMVLTALGVLEPGTGDELQQYVDPSGASRAEVVRDIRRADKAARDAQIDFEKEMAPPSPPMPPMAPGGVTPPDDLMLEFSVKRMQILAGIN
jgi:hypothetical protein